jgi:hypothetical protein
VSTIYDLQRAVWGVSPRYDITRMVERPGEMHIRVLVPWWRMSLWFLFDRRAVHRLIESMRPVGVTVKHSMRLKP